VFVSAKDLPGGLPARLALSAALLLVVAGIAWVSWWRTTYWFDEDGDFRIAKGLFTRNERRVQVSRLQSVEITRPLIARLVGLAELRPEVAGTENSKVSLQFLSEGEAHALRADLLARAAGQRGQVAPAAGAHPAPAAGPAGVDADERPLIKVPTKDLALSLVLNHNRIIVAVLILVFISVTVGTGHSEALLAIIIAGGVPGFSAVTGMLSMFDFTVSESSAGLRLSSGLLSTTHQTVPPGRVQAVLISQTLLWRSRGWYRVQINVAGSGGRGQNDRRGGMVLLPVAPYPVVRLLLTRVLPGVDIDAVVLVSAPPAARWRAPLQFKQLAAGSDPAVFVCRSGWLTRYIDVVPHARTQSVRVTQGPWQRRLGLATTHVDSTPGPVRPHAVHRDAIDARLLAEAQASLATRARAGGTP
jgi:putative membrane protein